MLPCFGGFPLTGMIKSCWETSCFQFAAAEPWSQCPGCVFWEVFGLGLFRVDFVCRYIPWNNFGSRRWTSWSLGPLWGCRQICAAQSGSLCWAVAAGEEGAGCWVSREGWLPLYSWILRARYKSRYTLRVLFGPPASSCQSLESNRLLLKKKKAEFPPWSVC